MSPGSPFLRAVIVGGNGAVGQMLFAALSGSGVQSVTLIDRRFTDRAAVGADCIVADILRADVATLDVIGASDITILALPEEPAVDALDLLLPRLSATALLVDTLSVKSRYAQRLAEIGTECELLGINPMFAPDLGFYGRSAIVVAYAARMRAQQFQDLLAAWGTTVVRLSVEQHDRACAALQVATHAAVLGFALALRASGYDTRSLEPIMPPPHRTLLALTGRILAADPAVYHDIQAANPYASEMRSRLREAQQKLEASIAAGPEEFANTVDELREMLTQGDVDYAALCARLFAVR